MSHSSGRVLFHDGTEYVYEYNGTCDVVMPMLYKTLTDLNDHWRREDFWPTDDALQLARKDDEPVLIGTSYGYGSGWEGRASKGRMLVTEGFNPFADDYSARLWDNDAPDMPTIPESVRAAWVTGA